MDVFEPATQASPPHKVDLSSTSGKIMSHKHKSGIKERDKNLKATFPHIWTSANHWSDYLLDQWFISMPAFI